MKRLLSFLIALTVSLSAFVFAEAEVDAVNGTPEILEFSCGLNATAYLDELTGVLTVRGTGDINFFYEDTPPWWAYRRTITAIVIEEGITSVASIAFLDSEAKTITLPSTIETIAADALSMTDIEEIIIPENNSLCELYVTDYFRETPWYKNQPDGPVYLGNMLLEYKGTMPQNTTVTVKDGTYAINALAFYNQSNLIDVVVPDSVERVGVNAFYGTSWFKSKPYYEAVYLGKVLYYYNFPWRVIKDSDIKDEFVIPEGIVSVSESAFDSHCPFKNIILSNSLEHIGAFAFYQCDYLEKVTVPTDSKLKHIGNAAFYGDENLESFSFPDGFERLDINVFIYCDEIRDIYIPSTVRSIGLTTFEPNSLDSFKVDSDNPYYCTDENGILYSKNKTVVYSSYQKISLTELTVPDTVTEIAAQAFAASPIKKINLPDSLKRIGFEAFSESAIESVKIPYGVNRIEKYAFYDCDSLTETEISKTVAFIDSCAFSSCSLLKKAIIPDSVKFIEGDVFEKSENVVFYCYNNSTAYYYAKENEIPYVILEHPDMSRLDALLEEYKTLNRDKYFEETLEPLDKAVSDVDMTVTVVTQDMVDGWSDEIESALGQLKYLPADYSLIEAAKARAELVDRYLYTAESLAVLDEIIASVDETLDVSNQHLADEYAKSINDAIDNLEFLPADYTKVNEAIAESEKIDRLLYSNATLSILDQSIEAVDYTLNITQQSIVDGFADRINTAVSSLVYADVVLRNEPNGVIVSATAKEIYPTTELTVDVLDPSDFEGANFAVGGHIKSVQYFDINLIRAGEKVQPDGKVLVKIKIPDGVTPEKCRVYHVTDDPVDPLVRFSSTLAGNYIVFETDHFSEFAVIEVETVLNGVSITNNPIKVTYGINEKIDLTGLEVSAVLSDGTSQIITGYDVSNVDMSSVGTKTVTVYYTVNGVTKSASFDITVVAQNVAAEIGINGETVNEYNRKVKWYKGYSSESVQLEYDLPDSENYSIEWSSDNSKVLVDENGKVTNKGFFFARSATITVTVKDSAGNVLASDEIIVRFYKFSFQLTRMQTAALISRKEED